MRFLKEYHYPLSKRFPDLFIWCKTPHHDIVSNIINFLFIIQFDPKSYYLNVVCVSRLPRNAQVEWHVRMRISETNDDFDDSGKCFFLFLNHS